MTQTITARTLITDIGSVEFPVITLTAEGTIDEIYSDPKALHQDTTTLTAAFLDVHTHGAMGHDIMDASPAALGEMQRFLATRGVAKYLPTTVTAAVDDILRALDTLANVIDAEARPGEAQAIGIHLEGPFLSHGKRGVHATELLQPPSIELFDRFWQAARGHIRLMTIAPEPNASTSGAPSSPMASSSASVGSHIAPSSTALDLIRHATALGVRCSVGHTMATAAETLAAIDAGVTSATHTFNAMRALDHREPGVLGTVLTDDRLFAELVCDGVHVAPQLVPLWLRAKGRDRAILVTDAMSATGMPDGDYTLAGLPVIVANGKAVLREAPQTLAGSVLTMDAAVANLQRFANAPLEEATRCASHNPAAMLGLPEATRLAPGSVANLNRFDSSGKLVATYLRGRLIG